MKYYKLLIYNFDPSAQDSILKFNRIDFTEETILLY